MIPERLAALREKMRAYGVDAYLVPTADYHESEYVGTYFKARTYITGFTGSAGTAVITQDEACLWTDGRYFVQAAKELAGTGVTLMKMGQEGVPTVEEYLQANTKEGMTIGFDGRVVNEMLGETLEKTLPERFLSYRSDLIGEIWSDRPALSAEPVWILDSKYTGESAADRLAKVREKMKENGAEVHILTALDDIAWMLNIRGNDIPCNPVVLSYLILTETEGHLFIQEATLNDEVKQYLAGLGISIHPYDAVYDFAAGITGKTILLEKAKVNYTICQSVMGENTIVNVMNPASSLKALKTPVEMENIPAVTAAPIEDGEKHITLEMIQQVTRRTAMRYDREGDDHYDIVSAYQKSMRGSDPDAALHYLARLLEAGDLPSACRRLMVCACEDVGLAYPQIIPIVKAAIDAANMVGLPEARLPLADAVILVATSPKSNSAHDAINAAIADVQAGRTGPIPRQLQNKHYDGEDALVKGQNYKYAHDYAHHWVEQQYLPDAIKDVKYYTFGDNKNEQAARAYWAKIKGEENV